MRDALILLREFVALAGFRGIWLFGFRGLQRVLGPKAYEWVARKTWMRAVRGSPAAGLALGPGGGRDFFAARFSRADLRREAERSRRQEFNFLGTNPAHWRGPVAWELDPKSGYRWPQKFYVAYGHSLIPGGGVDIKIPWELARFQHTLPFAQAYWQTGREGDRTEYIAAWRNWFDANPWGYGIHWAVPMEVAIRAVNWVVGMSLLGGEKSLDESDRQLVVRALRQHGIFIEYNLEIGVVREVVEANNHLLANVCGLACLGYACPNLPEAARWRRMGVRGLEQEMLRQVNDDGTSFESSTSYHRLALELFLVPVLLAPLDGQVFSPGYMQRLQRMFDVVMHLTGPGGQVPQVGDNDDGRLLITSDFSCWKRHDYRYLLGIGAVLFRRGDYKSIAGACPQEVFWLLGRPGVEAYDAIEAEPHPVAAKAFPVGGVYLMKDPEGRGYGLIRAGRAAPGATGHFHNDVLAVEVWFDERPILLDPGTMAYSSDPGGRNLFRSTQMHNTVEIDGLEINEIPQNLFRMGRNAVVDVSCWEETDTGAEFVARHDGYARLEAPVLHQRAVRCRYREAVWEIDDELKGEDKHTGVWNWHFAQEDGLEVRQAGNSIHIAGEGFYMEMELSDGRVSGVKTIEAKRALSYGRPTPYTRVRVEAGWTGRAVMRSRLRRK